MLQRLLATVLVAMSLVSCGDGGDVDATTETDGTTATAAESTTSETPVTDPPTTASTTTTTVSLYYSEPIGFTTRSGWTYALSVALGGVSVEFGKDIQTSPPGRARLTSTTSGPTTFGATVIGNTSGRTPPPLEARVEILFPLPVRPDSIGGYMYDLPGVDTQYASIDSAGACSETGNYHGYEARAFGLPGGGLRGLTCQLNDSGESIDLEEAFVDAVLAILQDGQSKPLMFVSVGSYACGVLYYPDGSHVIGEPLSSEQC